MKKYTRWNGIYSIQGPSWGVIPDHALLAYQKLIPKGPVLDLGVGDGRNAIFFAKMGYEVEAIDISKVALAKLKKQAKKMKLKILIKQDDFKSFQIQPGKYSLIISAWVLNFAQQNEINDIILRIKNGVKKNGYIYVSVFSTANPSFKYEKRTQKMIEKNTFYYKKSNTYFHYFEKRELLSSFRDLKLVYCVEGTELDINHAKPHYHDIIIYLAQRANTEPCSK